MNPKKITNDISGKIINLYLSGNSSIVIGKIFNISQGIISKHIKKLGLTRDRNVELHKNLKLQNDVKKLYLEGLGAQNISKKLNLPKHNILYFLRKEKLMKNRRSVDELEYESFWFENQKWYGYRICPRCNEDVLCYAQKKYLLFRNIRNKTKKGCLCRKCQSEFYSGEKNPFYGKKHTEESVKKMLKSQSKTLKPISKNEYLIFDIIKSSVVTIQQFIIEKKSYDFYIPKYNLIIEYNGDYWHCNPIKYEPNYFNKKKRMYAKEIWEYDKYKLQLCEKYGYNLEVIWEKDFIENKNIINEILKKYEKRAN